jgi:hypothetical protein
MDIRRTAFNFIPLWAFIVFVVFLSYMFFLRAPVILVSDIYAHALYGEQWEQIRTLEVSFKILRPVRIFRIMEETDSQSIADAVRGSRLTPHSVFFSYRYEEAARFYSAELEKAGNKTTKAFLFLNKERRTNNTESLIHIKSNTEIDYYRAAYCAAILSREKRTSRSVNSDATRDIVVIYDTRADNSEQNAFERGLRDGRYFGGMRFALNTELGSRDAIDCIVIEGPSSTFLQSVSETPVILLSWFYNENYFPPNVKAQIDDSPYALIPKALGMRAGRLKAGETLTVPANFKILKNNIINKKLIPELRRAMNAKLPSEIAP